MVNVDMTLIEKGDGNFLAFVKAIKDCTGLGLRESKNIADQFNNKIIKVCKISVEDAGEFQYRLNETGWIFKIESIKSKRISKLLELGLGDIDDKVENIAESLSKEIISRLDNHSNNKYKGPSANYITYNEFFIDLISRLDPEQIEKLYKKEKSETN